MARKKAISIYPLLESDGIQKRRELIAIERHINLQSQNDLENELPLLPKDRLQWEYHCRKIIKGKPNRMKYFIPIQKAFVDLHPFQFWLWARQWGKTVSLGSILAHAATTNYDYDQTYFNFKLDALRTFSNNKFRQDVFGKEPLSKYLKSIGSNIGATNKVETYTRSIIDMLLPGTEWENAQGKSNRRMVIDEGQDHNWSKYHNTKETMADTMGDTIIAGVGGYVDTDYHQIWKTTNQMEYQYKRGEPYQGYDNMSWRADLEFNGDGLVYDDYMIDVQEGDWIPKAPNNFSRHGYRISQTFNPKIPLTIQDAIEKYKVNPEWSIEWKKNDPTYLDIDFRRNVMAEFVEGDLKPITEKDMLNLFDDTQSLTKADDVNYDLGPVIIGIDWGGGSKTIIWIWQCIDVKSLIFKLLWVERVDTGDTDEQWEIVKNLCDAYEPDFISIDAGGASDRVQRTQKRYGNRSRRIIYTVRPEAPLPTIKEEIKQSLELRYVIDRTFSINRIIDLIKHPYKEKDFISNRIILPGKDFEKVKWIIPQFVAIEGEYTNLKSTGQLYIKYTHQDSKPDDALQACNYAFIGFDILQNNGEGHVGGSLDFSTKYKKYYADDMV